MDRGEIPLHSATASSTVDALRLFFASFGLPKEIVSDNGPQFTAQDFSDFCRNNGIKHTLIPPYHPATNGAAERAVQVIKQAVKKDGQWAITKAPIGMIFANLSYDTSCNHRNEAG